MNRAKIQAIGGFMTAMVIPNMGVFLAWGIITALFIEAGYFPHEGWATIVGPMLNYLIPVLLAYTGGKRVAGDRGGLIATVAVFGAIVGSDITQLFGAMVVGPCAALVIKKWDDFMEPRLPGGLEMLCRNFSLGIIGSILCIISFEVVGPVTEMISNSALVIINQFVETGFLPALAIICEPLKILFLNNLVDQGVLFPLGFMETETLGKSIFFMIASNPGPGFGLIMAYAFFGKGDAKETAKGASIVHFIGGIHEVYFPFVLMKITMIIPMILGSMTSIFIFDMFDVGMIAAPSPGSIVAYLLMTAKGDHIPMLIGVAASTAVTFFTASMVLKTAKDVDGESIAEMQAKSQAMKQEGKDILEGKAQDNTVVPSATAGTPATPSVAVSTEAIKTVFFCCDAGLGSSALGANAFKKKCGKENVTVECTNHAIEKIPTGQAQVVVVHKNFEERTIKARADKGENYRIVTIENYLKDPSIDALLEEVKAQQASSNPAPVASPVATTVTPEASPVASSKPIKTVFFCCDAGLGSSALGANAFKKKCSKENITLDCTNHAIEKIPAGQADVVVVHKNFAERTEKARADKGESYRIVTIENYMKDPNIDALLEEIKGQTGSTPAAPVASAETPVAPVASNKITTVFFCCDAGLGSSALGANAFKKKCAKENLTINCTNHAIEKIPTGEAQVVVVHKNFEERAQKAKTDKGDSFRIVTIENYLKDPNIDALLEEVKGQP